MAAPSQSGAMTQVADSGADATIRSASPSVKGLTAGWRRIASRRDRRARLRAGLALAPRERLLAAGPGPDGGYTLAATDRALYHRPHGGAWTRVGWEQVAAVSWGPGRARVIGLFGQAEVPVRDRGGFPEIIAERLAHSRLGSWRAELPGGRRVRIEARRRPSNGEVLWFVDAGAPRAQVERAIARLGEQSGVPPQPPVSLPWPEHR